MGVPAGPGVSASGESPYPRDLANGVVQGTISAVGPQKPFAFYGTLNLSVWTEFTTTLTTAAGSLAATVAAAGAIAAGSAVKSTRVPPGSTVLQIGTPGATDITLALPTLTYYGVTRSGIALIDQLLETDWLLGATVAGLGLAGTETVTGITTAAIAPNSAMNYPGVKGKVALSAAPTVNPQNTQPTPFEFKVADDAIGTGADAAAIFTGAAIGLTGSIQLERSFDGGHTWVVCNIGGSGMLAVFSTATPISIAFGEPERGVLYRLNQTALTGAAGNALKYRLSATGQAATTISVQTL